MATIREYFDNDVTAMAAHADWQFGPVDGQKTTFRVKIAWEFEANAKLWYFFVPTRDDIRALVASVLAQEETKRCVLSLDGDGLYVESGFSDYSEKTNSASLVFTKRAFLYVDARLTVDERRELSQLGSAAGYSLIVRDQEYAQLRSDQEKPLAFISHDSRDKDDFVRELAHKLIGLACPVWYDEYSLKVGDSLREKIESGLKNARKCVVVLSPHFLGNGGWTRAEFDTVFTREILEKENVILPVWHNVSVEDVYQYSPRLADKVGVSTQLGVEEVARRLAAAIKAR